MIIQATGIPAGGYAGFQSELVFGGIVWKQRPNCTDEVVWPDEDGFCLRATGLAGQAQHFAPTGTTPPFPASTFLGELLRLDVHCPALGTYKVSLVDEPSSVFGAVYFDVNGELVDIAPIGQEGGVDVVDTLTINCVIPPTATPTPSASATPTATPTPQPVESAEATIGSGGGALDTGSGDPVEAALSVPEGALAEDTAITIDVFNASDVSLPPGGGDVLSRAFDFGPDGTTFDPPATVTLT